MNAMKNNYSQVASGEPKERNHIELTAKADEMTVFASDPDVAAEMLNVSISDWSSCYISLTSTTIGAGIMGIPFAFSKCGWVLGTILICICAVLSGFGSHLLAMCALKTSKPASFYSVAEVTMPRFALVIDSYIAIICFGVTAMYLFIIGDSLPIAMRDVNAHSFFQSRSVCILLGFVVIAPLSFMPSLDALKFTSWLSGAMLLYMVLLIFLYACHIPSPLFDPCLDVTDGTCKGEEALALWDVDTVRVLSIFIFNFSCQQNVFTIVNELHDPTPQRLDSIFAATMGTAVVLYIITTFSAYSTFGSLVQSDILQMYPGTLLTTSCRVMISLIVALHYPIQLHPVRRSVLALLSRLNHRRAEHISMQQYSVRYHLTTIIHLLLSLCLALAFTDLGTMFAVLGATGSTLVIFILPGMFYYLLHRDDRDGGHDSSKNECCVAGGIGSGVKNDGSSTGSGSVLSQVAEEGGNGNGGGKVFGAAQQGRAFQQQPRWKLYAALGMVAMGMVVMPLCLFLMMF